ncbi:IS1 family transposase [Sorangium sp. So ce1078]|uniref:IS1 family transposase n=1 Tax=Sorangium sp. So ce1078 TaxID=3133329 RepID=UPI003F60C4C8
METRVRIASALVEGTSVRAVERMTGVTKSTILRFAVELGEGCARLHNRLVQGLCEPEIELDEQWSFIAKKDKRVTAEDPAEYGDVFTFTAFARRSKLVISFAVGKRDQATTDAFLADLRARVLVVPQITSDGLAVYVPAVEASFRGCADYAMVIKQYGYNKSPDHKYEPARDAHFIRKTAVFGAPDPKRMSTSGVERYHLTARHINGRKRRLARLALSFSKRLRSHRAAVALSVAVYNLARVHASLRVSPAMAAGIVSELWSVEDLVRAALAEPAAAPPVPQALTLPAQTGPVRQLPGGKGWLRLVTGGSAPAAPVAPQPPPVTPAPASPQPEPAATGQAAAPAQPPAAHREPTGQLDLFAWRPKPRTPVQLSLFGDPPFDPTTA